MKIRIEHIKEQPRSYSFSEPFESFPLLAELVKDGECSFNAPLQIEITAGREYDHYRVEGKIKVPVQMECSRCVCSFERIVNSRFTIFFREGAQWGQEQDELELNEQDLISGSFSGDEIDLSPEIADQVVLEIPVKPLCNDKCKGLCSFCGVDLNHTSCNCGLEHKESKFAALKDFKVRS